MSYKDAPEWSADVADHGLRLALVMLLDRKGLVVSLGSDVTIEQLERIVEVLDD